MAGEHHREASAASSAPTTDERRSPTESAAPTEISAALTQISRAVIRAHARFYGRGPERAHTTWERDHIVCALDEIFTPAEHTLLAAGRFDHIRDMRQAFQDEIEPLLRQQVEAITGRPVRAFFSQISADPEMAVEVFVLEP